MTSSLREPRRPNLATIVGSGLAVAAAGSLLAFSSLAEQAGLQGLATGGLQPAAPGRASGSAAITITVPGAPPGEPATPEDDLRDLVARVTSGDPTRPDRVVAEPAEAPARRPAEKRQPQRPDRKRPDRPAEPVLAARRAAFAPAEGDSTTEPYGPPYGKAKGHYKHGKAKPHPKQQKGARSHEAPEAPVYAKTTEAGGKKPKAPKMKKVTKAAPSSRGNGKGRGHDKHAHGKGRGKGHSKHGH